MVHCSSWPSSTILATRSAGTHDRICAVHTPWRRSVEDRRFIYDPKLGPNEVKGGYSGSRTTGGIFSSTNASTEWNAIASLAAAADVLKGWDDTLAKDCL